MTIKKVLYSTTSLFFINMVILLSYCYIDFLSPLNRIIIYLSYFLCGVFFFTLIIDRKFSPFTWCLLMFLVFGFVSCFLNPLSEKIMFLEVYLKLVGYIIFLERALKINTIGTVKTLNLVLFILVLINFITIIVFPQGLYLSERYSTNWFFKYDNTHIFMYFPSLMLNYVNLKLKGKSIDLISILNFIIITYCIMFCFSSNSIVAYFIFIIYLVFRKIFNKLNIFNSISYFITYIAIFFGFVIIRIQSIFEWFIVGVLHKKLTLTGRVYIWDTVIGFIKKRPIIGYGFETNDIITKKFGSIYFTHAHNTILDILYKGGILSLVSFIFLLYYCMKRLYEHKDMVISKYISIIFLCCFIMMNFEARQDKVGLYLMLVIANAVPEILKNVKATEVKM